ncbi:MAG: flotillin-like FloA family protein, partial [Planctomycetes bacterium]|nr:flotillin-like FloA family protein [Planctomycetota bacterium]
MNLNTLLETDLGDIVLIVFSFVFGLIGIFILALVFSVFSLWFQAMVSGAKISFGDLIGMKFRKVNGSMIVRARIEAHKAGVPITSTKLESHYLAGGNVLNVVRALIMASKAKLNMD